MNKTRCIISFLFVMMMLVGTIVSLTHSVGSENIDDQSVNHMTSQTSEYPPFVSPALNATTLDSGSIFVNGQELFWRYFTPNTSLIQPKNFRFSFEIWWENPDPDTAIVVDLSENEGESNSTTFFGTTLPYEKILEMPEGDFIHYAVWMNSTYFFMNETWASFGNEFIADESLNLTVGIQNVGFHPLFEYTIERNTNDPSIQIIHPNYDESERKLILDWQDTSFEIEFTSINDIDHVKLVVTFLNQTTFELDEVEIWPIELTQDEGTGSCYVPSLITEKVYPEGTGLADIDTDTPFPASLVVVDGYGYATSESLSIYLETSDSNTTTTPTGSTIDLETMIPIVGTISVVGIVAFLIKRSRN